jgi:hypothetical protein
MQASVAAAERLLACTGSSWWPPFGMYRINATSLASEKFKIERGASTSRYGAANAVSL